MYMKMRDAVKLGVRFDGNAPYFYDRGEVVVYVDEKQVNCKGVNHG